MRGWSLCGVTTSICFKKNLLQQTLFYYTSPASWPQKQSSQCSAEPLVSISHASSMSKIALAWVLCWVVPCCQLSRFHGLKRSCADARVYFVSSWLWSGCHWSHILQIYWNPDSRMRYCAMLGGGEKRGKNTKAKQKTPKIKKTQLLNQASPERKRFWYARRENKGREASMIIVMNSGVWI